MLSLIGVPVVRCGIDFLPLVTSKKFFEIVHAHATADDLTHAWHKDVDAFSDTWVGRVAFHVESFDFGGEVGQEDGSVNDVGHLALGGFGDVITKGVRLAKFIMDVVFVEPGDGVGVFHT